MHTIHIFAELNDILLYLNSVFNWDIKMIQLCDWGIKVRKNYFNKLLHFLNFSDMDIFDTEKYAHINNEKKM